MKPIAPCMTLLMQLFATRQSGSSGWSGRRRCTATTNPKLIYLIVDSESSTDEDLELLKYSRTLKIGEGSFDNGTCPH